MTINTIIRNEVLNINKLFLIISLMFILNYISNAQEQAVITVGKYSHIYGEQAAVKINIKAISNLCVGTLIIEYDNTMLELIDIEAGEVIKDAMPQFNKNYKANQMKAVFMTTTPINGDGELCQLLFKVIAKKGAAEIKISSIDFYDYEEKEINIEAENGIIDIRQDEEGTSYSNNSGSGGLSTPPPVFQTPAPQQASAKFEDIDEYGWALAEIEFLAGKGIIKGVTQTSFKPALNITRADYMVLMVRLLALQESVTDNFDDVKEEMYYYNEIGIAKKMGFANGVGGNMFNPELPITRQDMFCIAYRILKASLDDNVDTAILNEYMDSSQIADYAINPISVLIKNELVKGNDRVINPSANATRAETAVFIYRLYILVNSNR